MPKRSRICNCYIEVHGRSQARLVDHFFISRAGWHQPGNLAFRVAGCFRIRSARGPWVKCEFRYKTVVVRQKHTLVFSYEQSKAYRDWEASRDVLLELGNPRNGTTIVTVRS